MLKVGDVVKHKTLKLNVDHDDFFGIVEYVHNVKKCHVRTRGYTTCDYPSSSRVSIHEVYTYDNRKHLETFWVLV